MLRRATIIFEKILINLVQITQIDYKRFGINSQRFTRLMETQIRLQKKMVRSYLNRLIRKRFKGRINEHQNKSARRLQ